MHKELIKHVERICFYQVTCSSDYFRKIRGLEESIAFNAHAQAIKNDLINNNTMLIYASYLMNDI